MVRLIAAPGRVKDTLQALSRIRVAAQLDPDSLRTHLGTDADEPDCVFYFEEWTNRDSLARRINSAGFLALLGLMETSTPRRCLEVRDMSCVGGLDYVATVRNALEGHAN